MSYKENPKPHILSVNVLDLQRQIAELRETIKHMEFENKCMRHDIQYLFAVVGRRPPCE